MKMPLWGCNQTGSDVAVAHTASAGGFFFFKGRVFPPNVAVMTRCGFEASILALFIKPLVAEPLTHWHTVTNQRAAGDSGRALTSSSRCCRGDGGIQEVGLCQRSSQRPAAGVGGGGGFLAADVQMEIPAAVLDSQIKHWHIPTVWPPLRPVHSLVCCREEQRRICWVEVLAVRRSLAECLLSFSKTDGWREFYQKKSVHNKRKYSSANI